MDATATALQLDALCCCGDGLASDELMEERPGANSGAALVERRRRHDQRIVNPRVV